MSAHQSESGPLVNQSESQALANQPESGPLAHQSESEALPRQLKLRLLLAYDGSGFRGFALNPGVRTVAGVLTQALQKILKQEISLTCAGRTDAGVHAWGQVVSFEVEIGDIRLDLDRLRDSLNKMCGPEVVVRQADWASADFDARRYATKRIYRYRILNQPVPDPFKSGFVWHLPAELDVESMNQAAQFVVGEHDFASFCRQSDDKSLVRRVVNASWTRQAEAREVMLEIAASAFCHQMVRSLVGTFVEVGLRRRSPESLLDVIAAKDRHAAGNLAPPQGLCLWEVVYGDAPALPGFVQRPYC